MEAQYLPQKTLCWCLLSTMPMYGWSERCFVIHLSVQTVNLILIKPFKFPHCSMNLLNNHVVHSTQTHGRYNFNRCSIVRIDLESRVSLNSRPIWFEDRHDLGSRGSTADKAESRPFWYGYGSRANRDSRWVHFYKPEKSNQLNALTVPP